MPLPSRTASFPLAAALAAVASAVLLPPAPAQVCNVKVVTDASPDYSDLESMVRSITAPYPTTAEKCWALFYWNHVGRRQTSPMILHGLELTDPIRQFNDYGYTMCSTVAGVNCSLWHQLGLPIRFWDISLHTVSECQYEGRWHIYDNSMSALYTLCDGVTIAGVEDVGREGACAASGGQREPGHVAKYHCLNATSANGFLTGADTPRDLAQEYRCFSPKALKYRYYYHNWDRGHRYILNLRDGESYTRSYHSLGDSPEFYVPNHGKDPDAVNRRYHLRANGVWEFAPALTPAGWQRSVHQASHVRALDSGGLGPDQAGRQAEVVFKIQSANVTASQAITGHVLRRTAADQIEMSVSTNNGRSWQKIWTADGLGEIPVDVRLIEPVSGAYEILLRVALQAASEADAVLLKDLQIRTTTMLNSKTQPALRRGRNIVYAGVGEQTDSIVFWPELQAGRYRQFSLEEKNIATAAEHPGYQGALFAQRPNEEAYVVFRLDAPQDLTRVTYGGRFYNRAPRAAIWLSHSFDGGRTWKEDYRLDTTDPPWDVIHYATVESIPAGQRSVWLKYSLQAAEAGPAACSIYALRMEANHQPSAPGFRPLEVTFQWQEIQEDRSTVMRSHTQRIDQVPTRYTLDVGGADHPRVQSLQIKLAGPAPAEPRRDAAGGLPDSRRFVDRWVTSGRNLLAGKPYTVSVPPTGQWGGDDPQGTKLTDGIVGPLYAGGIVPSFGCCWEEKGGPVTIASDLGQTGKIGAFRIHLAGGWPWWDALQGEVRDEVEVFTSNDGQAYTSRGRFATDLRRQDVPINHLLPDDETAQGWNFELRLPQPVEARYVRFVLQPHRIVAVSEIQALDFVRDDPFELRIALPDEPR